MSELSSCTLVGPGGLGLYYGGLLAHVGTRLSVLARSDYGALQSEGIRIRWIDAETNAVTRSLAIRPHEVKTQARDIGPSDWVLVSCKATMNETLGDTLSELVTPQKTGLIVMQNGVGTADWFAEAYPDNPVVSALLAVCVTRVAPATVENYMPGFLEIGSVGDRHPEHAKAVVDALQRAGVTTSFTGSMDVSLWRKLCWNVAFNGLCITAGCLPTDAVLSDPRLAARARSLMEEVRAAARAYGHDIDAHEIDAQLKLTRTMGAYHPSSLVDYAAGRPIEVESIWGETLRRGRAKGLPMQEVAALYTELQELIADNTQGGARDG